MDAIATPLGRLYEHLSRYSEFAGDGGNIRRTWAMALDCSEQEVALELALLAAELLPAAQRQVEDADDEFVSFVWAKHEDEWREALLHQNVSLGQAVAELQVPNIMYLGLISSQQLKAQAGEGETPGSERIKVWVSLLRDLLDEVDLAVDIDVRARRAVARRLLDLIEKLENFDRSGPSGVQSAASGLLGELLLHRDLVTKTTGRKLAAGLLAGAMTVIGGVIGGVSAYPDFRAGALQIAEDFGWRVDIIEGELADCQAPELPSAPTPPVAVTDGSEQDEPPAA